jgi:uncharacterized MAPEG superfamily protein
MEYQLMPEWVLLCAVLLIKSVLQSVFQVWVRIRYQLYATGEDKKLFYRFRKRGENDLAKGEEKLTRYAKLWQNDLESIPYFLLIALGFTLLNGDADWGLVYFSVFAVTRSVYSVCYIKGLQPWRAMSWDIGLITMLCLTIHSICLAWPHVF